MQKKTMLKKRQTIISALSYYYVKFDNVFFLPKAWFENDKISTSVLPRCNYWHIQQLFFL